MKTVAPILSEFSSLKKLKTEHLCDSQKQTLGNQVEQLVGKLAEIYSKWIRKIKREGGTQDFMEASNSRSYFRDLDKQYGQESMTQPGTTRRARIPKQSEKPKSLARLS